MSVLRSQAWIASYSMVLKSSRDHDNTLKRVLQSDHMELRSEFETLNVGQITARYNKKQT